MRELVHSLRKNFQFKKIYAHGISFANRFLIMYVLPNNFNLNYLGVSVSKKVGKSVKRSYITRLIKENFRLQQEKFKTGFDIVIIARINASGANFYDIQNSLLYLAKKHKLLISI